MLISLMVVIFYCVHVYQIIMLYTLNIYSF